MPRQPTQFFATPQITPKLQIFIDKNVPNNNIPKVCNAFRILATKLHEAPSEQPATKVYFEFQLGEFYKALCKNLVNAQEQQAFLEAMSALESAKKLPDNFLTDKDGLREFIVRRNGEDIDSVETFLNAIQPQLHKDNPLKTYKSRKEIGEISEIVEYLADVLTREAGDKEYCEIKELFKETMSGQVPWYIPPPMPHLEKEPDDIQTALLRIAHRLNPFDPISNANMITLADNLARISQTENDPYRNMIAGLLDMEIQLIAEEKKAGSPTTHASQPERQVTDTAGKGTIAPEATRRPEAWYV
jgi:hypothetical protein